MITLSRQQKEAVEHTGSAFVHAGPGSGKTRVLISRIAYLVNNCGASPTEILAFTFTRAAAKQMRERLTEEIGEKRTKEMWILTIHAFCMRVISTWGWKLRYKDGISIYDDRDQLDIITQVQKDMGIKTKPESFLREINRGEINPKREKAFKEFEFRLKENNAINFIGLLDKAIYLMTQHNDVREHYAHKFRYVLLDEMNDTSDRDYSIAKLVSGKWKNLFAVGDLSQTIFSFRGSDQKTIDYLKADIPDHKEFHLSRSYRCPEPIVDACNKLIPHAEPLVTKKEGLPLEASGWDSEDEEALAIANKIAEGAELGIPYSDFAILCRTHALEDGIMSALEHKKIPFSLGGTTMRFMNVDEIRIFHDYLRVIVNGRDDFSFRRIINKPSRGIRPVTMARISAQAREGDISLLESTLVHFQDAPREEKQWLVDLAEIAKADFPDQYRSIYNLLAGWYDSQGLKTRVKNLNALMLLIAEWQQNTPEIISAEAYLRHLMDLNSQDDVTEDENTVKVMTVHTSKGLEFPIVIIPGCENMVFPLNNKADTPEKIESLAEERRLFYVALSRTQKAAHVTFSRRRVVRGKDRDQEPSIFIEEAGIPIVPGIYKQELQHD
jgi:DNA helicase-2/ATP-dependent DNA helicase PcrA